MDAEPGSFVPAPGRSYQNNCEKGQYQSESGQSECLMVSPGNFVPSSGAQKQFPCSLNSSAGIEKLFSSYDYMYTNDPSVNTAEFKVAK